MKSKVTFLIFGLIFIMGVSSVRSGDRMVLVERFTSSTCPPCASNNPIMDAFLASLDPEKIVGISFHMNWPAPGNDPFFLYNPNDNNIRRGYYNVNYIPQAKMEGIIHVEPPYVQGTLLSMFNSRKDSLSPVTMIVTDSTFGDSVMIRAKIFCELPLSDPNVFIHFVVVEKFIHFQYPPGTNGETDFYDVMRKMLPSGNGSSISLFPGQVITIEQRYKKDPVWQQNQIRNIVFIQAGDKELIGTAMKPANFTLTSSPAYRVVTQGQPQNATYKVHVPYVVSGYNSMVTLTAAVDPPASGVTVSFPGGNTISNFPDSVSMQVSSTSGVPAGAYRIIVTGTNTNGKIHKTAVSYLVGRSYIMVGANRPSLQFKVDNVTYSSSKMFTWDLNSVHSLAAVSPQTFGSTRYVFQNWSNSGDTVQNVTIGTQVSSYIVNYKTQFRLITGSQPSGIPATISGGNTFYDSSAAANFSITPLQLQYNNQTWYFHRWQGSGNGSYTGPNPSSQVSMHNVIVETAIWDTVPPIGIHGQGSEIPKVFELYQNYPNPFNPVTNIEYALPRSGFVTIKLFGVLGNDVAVLFEGYRNAGYHEVKFDGTNLASGIYFYRIIATDNDGISEMFRDVKRMVLIK